MDASLDLSMTTTPLLPLAASLFITLIEIAVYERRTATPTSVYLALAFVAVYPRAKEYNFLRPIHYKYNPMERSFFLNRACYRMNSN